MIVHALESQEDIVEEKRARGGCIPMLATGTFHCASVEGNCVCEKGTEKGVREGERGSESEGILAALLLLSSLWNQFVT